MLSPSAFTPLSDAMVPHLQAQLWREVSRQTDLAAALGRLTPLLARHFPVDGILIRQLTQKPLRLTTLAWSSLQGAPEFTPTTAVSEGHDSLLPACLAWLQQRRYAWMSAPGEPGAATRLVGLLIPPGIEGDCLVAPLWLDELPVAIVVLRVLPHLPPEGTADMLAAHLSARTDLLLEPLAVAYQNAQRLHEVTRMREALEADRRALLSRLQRQDITDVIIGESDGLRSVMERVEQVAPTDAPVLVLGETGSGKEVIARAIHTSSRRAQGPVVRVNCGAIPSELIDSELFGHERGSFTGAVQMRKGWFERADGGTLFLDEIGELPAAAQVRLLRVLQDGTLERIGGQHPLRVDVRIVAATHRDLQTMVAEGRFREDLWYRISVFPIRLPALREHMEDLPALATHFAERAGLRLGGTPLLLSPQDVTLLQAYNWPGNVRELAAVIERAAILGSGKHLEIAKALGAAVTPQRARPVAPRNAPTSTLEAVIASHIEQVLLATHGRIEGPHGAAQALGVNPHTLRARMRKLGIDWSRFRSESDVPPRSPKG